MDKKKILAVDDEAEVLILLKKRLESAGYEVFTATNGASAIELAKSELPNLIILDIMMPGLDGSETAVMLHNDPKTKDIPILFLTAIVREEEASCQTSPTMGYSFLSKTVTVGELIACIKKNVKKSAQS